MTKNFFGRTCGGAKQRNDGANVNSKERAIQNEMSTGLLGIDYLKKGIKELTGKLTGGRSKLNQF